MSHQLIATVNVFIIANHQVLLGRRQNTGWMDGSLCPPGGHVEPGETPLAAAIREVHEEVGVMIAPADLEFVGVAVRKTTEGETVAFEFVIRDKAYKYRNAEPERCDGIDWYPLLSLPPNVIPDFATILRRLVLDGVTYLELGYE